MDVQTSQGAILGLTTLLRLASPTCQFLPPLPLVAQRSLDKYQEKASGALGLHRFFA